jgi:hypothetical protein
LRQKKNNKSQYFGKWFAHSKSIETLNTRKLAKHISEHGSVYTQDVVFGVLEKFRSCLVEMLLESKRVNISNREFLKKAEFVISVGFSLSTKDFYYIFKIGSFL